MSVVRDGKPMTLTARIAELTETVENAATGSHDQTALGLAVQSLTPALAHELGLEESRGVVVRGVKDGSSAATAGLQPGDVILEVDHHPVTGVSDLQHDLAAHEKGAPILVLVHRNGSALYVTMAS